MLLALSVAAGAAESGGAFVYRGSASGAEVLTTTGLASWSVRSLEAVVRPLSGGAGSIGLVLNYQDGANHHLFLYSTNSSALMIYRKLGGAYTLLASTPWAVPFGEEHALRAVQEAGGELQLWWDGALALSVLDGSLASGGVGLRVWNMAADFDDVRALDAGGGTLLFDDFEDGDDDGWAAGPGWAVVGVGGAPMPIPTFDTSFEGGNGELTLVDPATWSVHVRPELKGSSPYRAWFYFRLSNTSPAQPTRFVFEDVDFFHRPAYSFDGSSWQEFPPPSGGAYALTLSSDPVWIAHSIPYLRSDEQLLLADLQGPEVEVSVLALSEGGLPVHRLRITAPGGSASKVAVWVTGRHHAWEASGSWVVDGLARWLASPDPTAAGLRLRAEVNLVPIMDVDSVVAGASGKDQQPIDFNRDWRAEPHWNAVAAAIAAIEQTAGQRPYRLFLDSHCPGSSSLFLAVQPQSMVSPAYWQDFLRFRQLLVQAAGTGPLAYTGSLAEWGPSYHPLWYQMSFWHQHSAYPDALSLTLETRSSTADGYRDLGAGLGRAIAAYLPCTGEAASYCTAGTSASGCRAHLAACGTASASASAGLDLIATGAEGAKDGLFFFGANGRQAAPWGNGTSYQCVAPPVFRAGLLTAGGSGGSCDGWFHQDLNALWCPVCPKPSKNPGVGAVVQAQLWYRDPGNSSNQTTSLSDAIELTVAP